MDDHWTEGLTHEQLATPEAKTILSKFETPDDAHVGYIELQKSAGKPFKLPKSLDKLPDDTTRADFTSQASKLLGLSEEDLARVSSEDDLKDVNFAEGLADARKVNENLVAAFKKFAVDTKLPKSLVSKLAKFNNGFATQLEAAQEAVKVENATKVNEVLKGLYGGDDGVKRHTEMVKRLFMNHCGLTSEEYEQSGLGLIKSGITQDAVLCKALFNLAKDVVPEATTGITEPSETKTKEGEALSEQMPDTAKALGW